MTHPIAVGLMTIVLVLGVFVGLAIHAGRDFQGGPLTQGEFVKSMGLQNETGEFFGFISAFESSDGTVYLSFDEANYFVGSDAIEAALAAGACTPEEIDACAPNDFYIANGSSELHRYAVSDAVRVHMETLSHTSEGAYVSGEAIALSELRQLFEEPRRAVLWRQIPFWVTVQDGLVVGIREQYVP